MIFHAKLMILNTNRYWLIVRANTYSREYRNIRTQNLDPKSGANIRTQNLDPKAGANCGFCSVCIFPGTARTGLLIDGFCAIRLDVCIRIVIVIIVIVIIIVNATPIISNTKVIIFDTKSIILNAKFINFDANRYRRPALGFLLVSSCKIHQF